MTDYLSGWGDDLVRDPDFDNSNVGLESFNGEIAQGPSPTNPAPWFKPINIRVENGVQYATIYVCDAFDGTVSSQQLAIWAAGLKDTDYVHLTVMSLLIDVPLQSLLSVMSALASTKATVEIHVDMVVTDGLAYFYLLADKITRGSEGALFIPSYVDQRDQDKSGPWKAVHDFYAWVVDDAVSRQILTEEEGSKLHRGSHVIVPNDRFDPRQY